MTRKAKALGAARQRASANPAIALRLPLLAFLLRRRWGHRIGVGGGAAVGAESGRRGSRTLGERGATRSRGDRSSLAKLSIPGESAGR